MHIVDGIEGTLCRPEPASGAAVLMLHGFASSRDEVGGMYERLAAALAEWGIISLRIDFRGFGDSPGEASDMTIDRLIDDAKAAAGFLRQAPGVAPERMGLLGFSLGGGVAIETAAAEPMAYKSLATWSCSGNFVSDFTQALGQAAFDTAAEQGIVELELGWRTLTLKKGFFDSLARHAPATAIAGFPGALLMIAGSDDWSAAYPAPFVDQAMGLPKEAWVIPGGDHIFNVLGADRTMADRVVERTAAWFAATL